MGGCAVPDASGVRSSHAERVVLAGLLHDGAACAKRLEAVGINRGDFYFEAHGLLFDVCVYACVGSEGGPILSDVFTEVANRKPGWLGGNFSGWRHFTDWLVEVYTAEQWMPEMYKWADVYDKDTPQATWCALAAAAKVRHLAARRRAIYAAMELIRDAADPTDDADNLGRRANYLSLE